jgi:hypothetical protein
MVLMFRKIYKNTVVKYGAIFCSYPKALDTFFYEIKKVLENAKSVPKRKMKHTVVAFESTFSALI